MAESRGIAVAADGRPAVEFVRGRKVVRINDAASSRRAIEMPLGAFLERLGIDVADLAPARQYLLFAGSGDNPAGGLGDLVDVFGSEVGAREAFHELRVRCARTSAWAELAALSPSGGLRTVCWFGRRPSRDGGGGKATEGPVRISLRRRFAVRR